MQGSLLGFLHSVLSDIYSANHSIKKEKKVRQDLIYSSTIKRFPNHFCPHTVQKAVLWCIWRVILFPLYAETRYYIGKKATLNHHREAI